VNLSKMSIKNFVEDVVGYILMYRLSVFATCNRELRADSAFHSGAGAALLEQWDAVTSFMAIDPTSVCSSHICKMNFVEKIAGYSLVCDFLRS